MPMRRLAPLAASPSLRPRAAAARAAPSLLAACALVALALAGCSGGSGADGGPTGTLTLALEDSAPQPVTLTLSGAYAQEAGNGTWRAAARDGAAWALSGAGGADAEVSGTVPAGAYERFRVIFRSVEVAGAPATLAETGFELPVQFAVPEGGRVTVRLNFSWADALFQSPEGLTFTPALQGLGIEDASGEVTEIEREQLVGKAPVARMRVFDGGGFQAFTSDFVADSPPKRIIATAGNFTFSSTGSEAVQKDADLVAYEWDFGDGSTASGLTVFHTYALGGGNFTARLSVRDSLNGTDSQTVGMALKPGRAMETTDFTGTLTGVAPCAIGNTCYPPCFQGTCAPNPAGGEPGIHTFPVQALSYAGKPALLFSIHGEVTFQPGQSGGLTDVDIAIFDAAGEEIGRGSEINEGLTGEEASGNWTLQVIPRVAQDVPYNASVTVTWVGIGDPAFLKWIEDYDDGHTHQHP